MTMRINQLTLRITRISLQSMPKQKAPKSYRKQYMQCLMPFTQSSKTLLEVRMMRPSGWQKGLWGWRVLCTVMKHALFFVDIIFSLDWDEIPESVGQNSQISAIPHGSNRYFNKNMFYRWWNKTMQVTDKPRRMKTRWALQKKPPLTLKGTILLSNDQYFCQVHLSKRPLLNGVTLLLHLSLRKSWQKCTYKNQHMTSSKK